MFTRFNIQNILKRNGIDDPDGKFAKALFEIIKEYDKKVGVLGSNRTGLH
ncbi:hypothetical protein [Paucilactobacillus kaifaensis]|nr:hypothetical protein [Paucilactobacillus kaifaensis]